MVLETLPSRDQLVELYHKAYDPETRVELVVEGLKAVGADKYLSEKQVSTVANCSTAAGLVEKAQEVGPIYCPKLYERGTGLYEKTMESYEKYAPAVMEAKGVVASKVALARDADGRRKLLAEGKELAEARIVSPATKKAAPYIQKLADKKAAIVEKKDALLADKRLVRALETLKEARKHPKETAIALKLTALDLIKYEKLAEYREYVQSEAFAVDTRRMVQEDLPALVRSTAQNGMATLHAKASALSAEIERSAESLKAALSKPGDLLTDIPALERLVSLALSARALLADLTLRSSEYMPPAAKLRLEALAAYISPSSAASPPVAAVAVEGEDAVGEEPAEPKSMVVPAEPPESPTGSSVATTDETNEAGRAFEAALEAACKEMIGEDPEEQ